MYWRNNVEAPNTVGVESTHGQEAWREFIRPTATIHIAVELLPLPLLRGILVDGGRIGRFAADKGYVAKTFIPPAGSALSTLTKHPNVLIGVSLLQERDDSGVDLTGRVSSVVRLTEATDWLRVGNMTDSVRARIGMPPDEPVYARFKPPSPREYGVAECIVEFRNGCEAQLSEIADTTSASESNARLVFMPLNEEDHVYLNGIDAYPEMLDLLSALGVEMAPPSHPDTVPRLISPVLRRNQALPGPTPVQLAAPVAAE